MYNLNSDMEYVRFQLSRPAYDIYSKIKNIKSSDTDIVKESLEHFVASQKRIYEDVLSEKKDLSDDLFFQDFALAYAYREASAQSLEMFSHLNEKVSYEELLFESGYSSLLDQVLSVYSRLVDSCSHNIESKCGDFFSWLNSDAERFLASEKYHDLMLQFDGKRKFFSSTQELSLDLIVGNKQLVSQIHSSIRLLFLYDLKNKMHPHISNFGPYAQRLLAHGSPGCGKSLTIEVMLEEARRLSVSSSKPLIIQDISAHLKSKYFGESAKNFSNVFNNVNKGDALHILIADDIDTVMFSRSGDEHSENISILGEFIRSIEGVSSVNRGNYLLLATTNAPEMLDPALFRRFQKVIPVLGPETPSDYEQLLKMKLSGYEKSGLLQVSDWKHFSNLLYKKRVSGSFVADVASEISSSIVDVAFDDSIYTKSGSLLVDELVNSYRVVSDDVLESIFKKHGLCK